MIINHNTMALNSYNKYSTADSKLAGSLARLSSGLRINKAADDAAGLAISEKMKTQIKSLEQASRNALDGNSLIMIAESALSEVHAILCRMRELAVQAANDTYTSSDRMTIQNEIEQLISEIGRIATATQFNEKNLLDGTTSAIVSTDRLTTKVYINDSLRIIDQFGQKSAGGGNYIIEVSAKPGVGEAVKTNIFYVDGEEDERVLHAREIIRKSYEIVTLPGGTNDQIKALYMYFTSFPAPGNLVDLHYIATELRRIVELANDAFVDMIHTVNDLIVTLGDSVFDPTKLAKYRSQVYNHYTYKPHYEGAFLNPIRNGTDAALAISDPADAALAWNQLMIAFRGTGPGGSGGAWGGGSGIVACHMPVANAAWDLLDITLPKKEARLYDLKCFWDANGNFMIEEPKTLTIMQGDGVKASVTIYGNDTLGTFIKKLNEAIGGKNGLNQDKLTGFTSSDRSYVQLVTADMADIAGGGLSAVPGVLLIQSAVPGKAGELNFIGDAGIINALGLTTVRHATETEFTANIINAHDTAKIIASDVHFEGNLLAGILHPNIDVKISSATALRVSAVTRSNGFIDFNWSPAGAERTYIHIADRSMVFHIGSN